PSSAFAVLRLRRPPPSPSSAFAVLRLRRPSPPIASRHRPPPPVASSSQPVSAPSRRAFGPHHPSVSPPSGPVATRRQLPRDPSPHPSPRPFWFPPPVDRLCRPVRRHVSPDPRNQSPRPSLHASRPRNLPRSSRPSPRASRHAPPATRLPPRVSAPVATRASGPRNLPSSSVRRFRRPASGVRRPASGVRRPASGVRRPASGVRRLPAYWLGATPSSPRFWWPSDARCPGTMYRQHHHRVRVVIGGGASGFPLPPPIFRRRNLPLSPLLDVRRSTPNSPVEGKVGCAALLSGDLPTSSAFAASVCPPAPRDPSPLPRLFGPTPVHRLRCPGPSPRIAGAGNLSPRPPSPAYPLRATLFSPRFWWLSAVRCRGTRVRDVHRRARVVEQASFPASLPPPISGSRTFLLLGRRFSGFALRRSRLWGWVASCPSIAAPFGWAC
ncbi:hypothetical protein B0I32_1101, partial [Nonomuraea fuscirosea]